MSVAIPVAPVLCLIVAVAENGVIGQLGKMPWHLPAELRYFRARTLGKPVIMGRKTFDSIGKPLPRRDNIVITRANGFTATGVTIVHSLDEALRAARTAAAASGANEIMVIGGGEIFTQALPMAARIYLTRIATRPDGDARFPDLDATHWGMTGTSTLTQPGADEPVATACVYDRVV